VRYHDAPYSRFGYGATVVELHWGLDFYLAENKVWKKKSF
jgi:hypothetical protein